MQQGMQQPLRERGRGGREEGVGEGEMVMYIHTHTHTHAWGLVTHMRYIYIALYV